MQATLSRRKGRKYCKSKNVNMRIGWEKGQTLIELHFGARVLRDALDRFTPATDDEADVLLRNPKL